MDLEERARQDKAGKYPCPLGGKMLGQQPKIGGVTTNKIRSGGKKKNHAQEIEGGKIIRQVVNEVLPTGEGGRSKGSESTLIIRTH